MMESDDQQRAAQRAEWVRQHDWKARVDQLEKAIETAFPKVSVIVLTYNNLSFTQACLHSLEANTHYPDWELVLVDNGSTDGNAGLSWRIRRQQPPAPSWFKTTKIWASPPATTAVWRRRTAKCSSF